MAVLVPSIATIFLLSPGTGSTSLSTWLVENMGGIWIFPGRTGKHATPSEIAATGLDLSRYTVVTTTRNPFDFYISQYNKKRNWPGSSPDFLLAKNNPFDVFLRSFLIKTLTGYLHPIYLNAADVVFRKEYLEEDLNEFLRQTHIPRTAKLPKINVAHSLSHELQDWYDSSLLALIEEKHAAHFTRFGYTRISTNALRPLQLTQHTLKRISVPPKPDTHSLVLSGQNDWLYLSDQSNRVISCTTGKYDAHSHWIEAWKKEASRRGSHAQAVRADIATYIIPNTHSAVPDFLPANVTLSTKRPINQLLSEITEFNYLLEPLQDPDCFVANDSHYSPYGAYLTYRHICLKHGLSPIAIAKADFVTVCGLGDLGVKLFPGRGADYLFLDHKKEEQLGLNRATTIFKSGVKSAGRFDVYFNPDPELIDNTLLIFGDSYSSKIALFMAHNFRHVVLLHSTRPPLELIGTLTPNLVLFIHAERFMLQVPHQQASAHRSDYRSRLQQLAAANIPTAAPSYRLEEISKLPGLLLEIAALENIYDEIFPNPNFHLGKLGALGRSLLHRDIGEGELRDKATRHPTLASAMREILHSEEFTTKNGLSGTMTFTPHPTAARATVPE